MFGVIHLRRILIGAQWVLLSLLNLRFFFLCTFLRTLNLLVPVENSSSCELNTSTETSQKAYNGFSLRVRGRLFRISFDFVSITGT